MQGLRLRAAIPAMIAIVLVFYFTQLARAWAIPGLIGEKSTRRWSWKRRQSPPVGNGNLSVTLMVVKAA
jgi:hypothetical protein